MLNIASFGILVYFSEVASLHNVISKFKVHLASPSHNFKRHFDEEIFDLEICRGGGGTLGQAFLTTFVKFKPQGENNSSKSITQGSFCPKT